MAGSSEPSMGHIANRNPKSLEECRCTCEILYFLTSGMDDDVRSWVQEIFNEEISFYSSLGYEKAKEDLQKQAMKEALRVARKEMEEQTEILRREYEGIIEEHFNDLTRRMASRVRSLVYMEAMRISVH